MSFIFKRNKAADPAPSRPAASEEQSAKVVAETAAGETHEANAAAASGGADAAVTRWRASTHAAEESPEPAAAQVRHAYERWHAALTRSANMDGTAAAMRAAVVDLTHMHPTGAAQLYAGANTMLSSLVREERAYQRASAQLGKLDALVKKLSDAYGYAKIAITAGEARWSERQPAPAAPRDTAEAVTAAEVEPNAAAANTAPNASETAANVSEAAPAEPAAATAAAQAAPNTPTAETSAETSAEPTADSSVHPVANAADTVTVTRKKYAPMLMRAVAVKFLAHGDAHIQLRHSLALHGEFRDALLAAGVSAARLDEIVASAEAGEASAATIDAALAQLAELAHKRLPDFAMETRVLLGCFTHPALEMVADLEAIKPFILDSGVMAALAGDEQLRALTAAPLPPGLREDRAPEVERGVGDLDADELSAVEAVASGRSLVLDCPPGSRRLQTIVSIAADAAATGRSLLIVPADASAKAALLREFTASGGSDLVLDFWDRDAAAYRLRTGLRLEKPHVERSHILQLRSQLVEVRRKLATFVNDLHRHDAYWDTSVHDLLEQLAALMAQPDPPRTRVRFTAQSIQGIAERGLEEAESSVRHAAELGIFDDDFAHSLWLEAHVNTEAEAKAALELIQRLTGGLLAETEQQCDAVSEGTGLLPAQTPAEWAEQVRMLAGIADSLDTFLPQIFEQSPDDMVIATATKEWRAEHGYRMKKSEQRLLRKQVNDLLRPGISAPDVHAELLLVQERQAQWRKYAKVNGWPILPANFTHISAQSDELIKQLSELTHYFPGTDFAAMQWQELAAQLRLLEREEGRLDTLLARNLALKELLTMGIAVFIEDMHQRHVSADRVTQEFRLACTSSIFEQLMVNSPILASLGPRDVSELLETMRTLDRAHVASLADPVLFAAVMEMRNYARAHRDATLSADAILARDDAEALKEAIRSYPRIVQLARPIWIMPAGLVAEYLPAEPWADVCVYDASPDAPLSAVISVIMRGRQAVVVGDTRRAALVAASGLANAGSGSGKEGASGQRAAANTLNTLNTPESGQDEQSSELAVSAFSRVLPVVQLPTNRVQLNEITTLALAQHGYAGVYSPIPKNPQLTAVRLIPVEGKGMPTLGGDGSVETTTAEVEVVVDAIADHALAHPERSLAVIALNEKHAARIRDAYRAEAANSPILREFSEGSAEPFEIVNVTQVAGLHRDHVILAVGYGKTIHGRVLHSFGVLAQPAGFLGLADAVEAARRELTVVSALGAEDLEHLRLSTPGPQLLRDVLKAASGALASKAGEASSSGVAPLLDDLAARLHEQGFKTARNFGYPGSQSIPLVAGSEEIPGTWAVAVLLDDSSYVAEPSLRRRDRHRIETYEEAGWKVFQTYSTSLFVDPAGQAQTVGELIRAAIAQAKEPKQAEAFAKLPALVIDGEELAPGSRAAETAVTMDASAAAANAPAMSMSAHDMVQAAVPVNPVARGPRPSISVGLPLVAYTDDQLDDMLAWIASDRLPRTAEELRAALHEELGLARHGGQVDLVLGNAVRRSGLAVPDKRAFAPAEAENTADGAASAKNASKQQGDA